jgi:hypothetical protein
MGNAIRRQLAHVTLDTGDVALVPSSHVGAPARAMVGDMLERFAAAGEAQSVVEIPWGIPGPRGGALRWGVQAAPLKVRCWSADVVVWIDDGWVPVAHLGMATDSRCGARVWEAMHEMPPALVADVGRQPATPWLASRMSGGVMLLPRPAMKGIGWVAGFAERLAWAWVWRVEGGESAAGGDSGVGGGR